MSPLFFFLLACGDAKDTGTAAGSQDVQLTFDARFGDEAAACGSAVSGVGLSGSTVELQDLRLFVHDVRLVTAGGDEVPVDVYDDGVWQAGGVTLLDFEDGTGSCANGNSATNAVVSGTVAEGDYVGVVFTVGVPEDLNHEDPTLAASPLNLTAMHWSWQGGYKFVRMDLSTTGFPEGWFFHLGSTGCEADADGVVTGCSSPNRAEVSLDLDPDTQAVVLDLSALLAGSDVDTDGGGAQGCMSSPDDPECPALLEHVGADLFSAE